MSKTVSKNDDWWICWQNILGLFFPGLIIKNKITWQAKIIKYQHLLLPSKWTDTFEGLCIYFLLSLKENAFVTTENSNTNSTLKTVLKCYILLLLTESYSDIQGPKFGARWNKNLMWSKTIYHGLKMLLD